jgi:xanthine dehydrogenase accessory factor
MGAGEMATGIARRLFECGFTSILMSEAPEPLAVRRGVAFCEAVHEGSKIVEGVRAERIDDISALAAVWERKAIGVLVDAEAHFLKAFDYDILIDATMMKKPKGWLKREGPAGRFFIGVGPGFKAPDGVDAVIETNRGHDLGRVIYEGEAEAPTGVPGVIEGVAAERVLRAPHAGMVRTVKSIGDAATKGDVILYVDDTPVLAAIDGLVRGLIRPIRVWNNEKLGDIDPRGEKRHCFTISEKASAIAGGVLEAIMHRYNRSDCRS